MEKPIPDGYIMITFREPYHNKELYASNFRGYEAVAREYDDFVLKILFADIECLVKDDDGMKVRHDWGVSLYPWSSIQELEHRHNSEEYTRALKAYQEQHDHNWICSGDYHPGNPPGFYWYCGPSRDGSDTGCELSEHRQRDDQGRTITELREFFENLGEF